jgi:hypothetical protein
LPMASPSAIKKMVKIPPVMADQMTISKIGIGRLWSLRLGAPGSFWHLFQIGYSCRHPSGFFFSPQVL